MRHNGIKSTTEARIACLIDDDEICSRGQLLPASKLLDQRHISFPGDWELEEVGRLPLWAFARSVNSPLEVYVEILWTTATFVYAYARNLQNVPNKTKKKKESVLFGSKDSEESKEQRCSSSDTSENSVGHWRFRIYCQTKRTTVDSLYIQPTLLAICPSHIELCTCVCVWVWACVCCTRTHG